MLASGNCQIKLRWAEALTQAAHDRKISVKARPIHTLRKIFFILFILANKLYELALCAL